MSLNQLWVEKYRPKTIDGYVFTDPETKELVEHWIQAGTFPHVLLHGPSGTGKTTLAKILINAVDVEDTDVLYVNGSKEGRKIDWLRDRLEGFCQTMPFGPFKIVLIDEADYLNRDSVQPAMRNLMEDYSESVRFILTCNFPNRILGPLKSRCHDIRIDRTDMNEFTARAATVLCNENIDFELDVLDSYVRATYPDLRKCLNLLQPNSVTGHLISAQSRSSESGRDFRLDAVDLFKAKKYRQARQLLCNQVRPEEMEELFRWAYDNLDLWSDNDEGKDDAIIIIRRGLVNHNNCSDPEINLSATLTELSNIGK